MCIAVHHVRIIAVLGALTCMKLGLVSYPCKAYEQTCIVLARAASECRKIVSLTMLSSRTLVEDVVLHRYVCLHTEKLAVDMSEIVVLWRQMEQPMTCPNSPGIC